MSLKNLKSTAQKATTLSDLMLDREQLTTAQLNGQTLTPIAVDIAAIQGKSFPVFVFSEYPDHYYNGGIILMKIVEAWLGDYEGDITALNVDGGEVVLAVLGQDQGRQEQPHHHRHHLIRRAIARLVRRDGHFF